MIQKITIAAWAAQTYSVPISRWVLNKWRRNGEIYPPPERVGHQWMVWPHAQRVTGDCPYEPLRERASA